MRYTIQIGQMFGSNRQLIEGPIEDKELLQETIADYINTFKHIPVASFDEIRESSDKSIGFGAPGSDVYFITDAYIVGTVIYVNLIA